MANKIDSNVVGLFIAEEESLSTLPVTPIWYEQEPNSFSDFGGDFKTVARNPISISRQRKKGSLVDLSAAGGYSSDLTMNNIPRLAQGFFFADAHEKASTKPYNGTAVTIASVTSGTLTATSGLDAFKAKDIVHINGAGNTANNGITTVTSAEAATLTVAKTMVAESTPPVTLMVETVGVEFASSDAEMTVTGTSEIALETSTYDLTTLDLSVGEWVFIGGDTSITKFGNCPVGYGRIKTIAAHKITFSETTMTAVSDPGVGKTIRMFFGKYLRNESTSALIKRRSYQLERQLGEDADGVQSEYVIGAIPNEISFSIPEAAKMTVDMGFVGMNVEQRTGEVGVKSGTRVASLGETAINTSSDVYRMYMSVVDPVSLNSTSMIGYVSDAQISVKNNVTANKAVGVLGSFDASAGDFEVDATINAFFSDTQAVQAVRENSDVSVNIITSRDNAGIVFDMPLVSLAGGKTDVQKDSPIKLPLTSMAGENSAGYTFSMTFFKYLPHSAMS